MSLFETAEFDGHEEVAFVTDRWTPLRAILAVHDTTLGPALGGCRMLRYASSAQALQDALRLSRAMTYKAACAGIPFGGGKCVVLGDPHPDERPGMLRALGARLARLDGRFFLGEDVGTSPQDMAIIHRAAPNVVGLPTELGGSGDPSVWTVRGCLAGMRAAAAEALGVESLAGVRVAIQGLGSVGGRLCRALAAEGAALFVADVRPERARAAAALGASMVAPEEVYDADAEIFAPCALGGTLRVATVERLQVRIVAGCANNQLEHPGVGAALQDRGILYAPDYVINAGGMIRLAGELLGWDDQRLQAAVDGIAATLGRVVAFARTHRVPTSEAADHLAADRLRRAARRTRPVARVTSAPVRHHGGMMEQPFTTLAEQIAAVAPKVAAATSDADLEALRRRPAPDAWCALEVVGHLVDKMGIWRARVQAIASQERPHLDLYDQDALVLARSYRTAQLGDLLEELAAGCGAFAGTVRAVPDELAGRIGIHPEHGQITLRQCVEIPLASVGPHLAQLRAALAPH